MLEGSDYFIAAVDDSKGDVIGFITAITDHVLTVYIPLLEVLPAYQKRGVGSELMKRLIDRFHDFYKIDLCCDEELQGYYQRFGMKRIHAMTLVNYERQSGRKDFEALRQRPCFSTGRGK